MDAETVDWYVSKNITQGLNLIEETRRPDFSDYLKREHHKLQFHDGYMLWPGFQSNTAKYAYDNFTPRQEDVLVASYPRTGTTWTLSILRHMLYRKNPDLREKVKCLGHFYAYLEYGPVCKYEVVENLDIPSRFFGTHLLPKSVNTKKFPKIICTVRNPKDQLVSWYHFVKVHPFLRFCPSIPPLTEDYQKYYDAVISGNCTPGEQQPFVRPGEGYLEHLRDWYRHKDDGNIMFVVYENMIENPRKEISRIADFLGIFVTDEELSEIVELTSFSNMKAESGIKLRKGQVGEWKKHLSVRQSKLIDEKVESILADTDIKFIYE